MEPKWSPMVEIGTIFKNNKTGYTGYVAQAKGTVVDSLGNTHFIQDLSISLWTQEELDRAKAEASRLHKSLFGDETCQKK